MSKDNRLAIFIDAENVADWLKHGGIELLLPELKTLGQIIIRRAYGVWSNPRLAPHQAGLNRQGFELVHCYHPVSGKNSADIQMTVDVMECAWQIENITTFVLVTGDSDFSPLFRRLREMGKEVIGVGRNSTLSECVKTSCSQFIYTDKFLAEKKNKVAIEVEKPKKDNKILNEVVLLIHEILKQEKEPLNISQLKERLIELNPVFHQQKLEFKNWLDFLNTLKGIELSQKGSLWFAQEITLKEEIVQKPQKEPVKKQPKKNETLLIQTTQVIHKILKEEKEPLNISMLRTKLVVLNSSFDHKNLGFKRWIDFLQTIEKIKLTKKGSVWSVSAKESESQKDLEKKYRNLLNLNNKHLISSEILKIIYKEACSYNHFFPTMVVMKQYVIDGLSKKGSKVSKIDINKCFHLFSCMNLISINIYNKLEISKLSNNDFLLLIDKFMISNLFELSKKEKIELKIKEIKKLTYSTISKDEIKKIISF